MALPVDGPAGRDDGGRAASVDSYRVTCAGFIEDISADYLAWVDRYALPPEEDRRRRAAIAATIERTNYWIAKVATSIRGVDVVMNDGIQKMAEATAGQPFPIGVFVSRTAGYARAPPGRVPVRVRATPREGRAASIAAHSPGCEFRLESTGPASVSGGAAAAAPLDAELVLDASRCSPRDVASFTVVVSEEEGGRETERRGVSTIVHIA